MISFKQFLKESEEKDTYPKGYRAGYNAYYRKKKITDNPCTDPEEKKQWASGWNDARKTKLKNNFIGESTSQNEYTVIFDYTDHSHEEVSVETNSSKEVDIMKLANNMRKNENKKVAGSKIIGEGSRSS